MEFLIGLVMSKLVFEPELVPASCLFPGKTPATDLLGFVVSCLVGACPLPGRQDSVPGGGHCRA